MRKRLISEESLNRLLREFGSLAIAEGIWFALPEQEQGNTAFPEGYVSLIQEALCTAKEGCGTEPRRYIQFRRDRAGKQQMIQIRYSCDAAATDALVRLQQTAESSNCFFRYKEEPGCVCLQLAAECV